MNYDIAIRLADSVADEANTIAKYTAYMKDNADENVNAQYKEVVSDELNHLFRFALEYAKESGIKIAIDGLDELMADSLFKGEENEI